jgi:NADH-quinone oxidoreductase subunit E
MSIKVTHVNGADQATPQFSEERMAIVQRIIKEYPEGKHKSALMRIMHMAEEDFGGWLSVPTMNYIAEILNIQPSNLLYHVQSGTNREICAGSMSNRSLYARWIR